MFSSNETTDMGADTGSPVYGPAEPEFAKAIKWVRIDTGDDDHSHLIPPEAHLEVIMSRQ
jgi:arylsulfatase